MGRFITIEGGEGTGKSTQACLLAKALRRRGTAVVTTREPGGSPGAEKIRELLLDETVAWDPPTEALLQFAARADHYVTLIAPALRRGDWVVSDRFADSTRAYQGSGMGVAAAAIETLYELALGDFRPDLTLILDLSVERAMKRLEGREGRLDRYERKDAAFHKDVRDGFLRISEEEPERVVVIDADAPVEIVSSRIEKAVAGRLSA